MTPLSIQEVRSTTVHYDLDPDGDAILVLVDPETNSDEKNDTDSVETDSDSSGSMVVHCGDSSELEEDEGAEVSPSNTRSRYN